MTDRDEDLDDYLDPELDAAVVQSNEREGGLFSRSGLIRWAHFMAALLVLPVAWSALQNGAYGRAGFYAALGGLMAAAGILVGRIARRRSR